MANKAIIFLLPEDFLTVKETVKDYVPVDTKTVSLKLLVLLVMICDWCLWQVN